MKREGKYRPKARECLIIEALAAKLVLRAGCYARSDNASRTDRTDRTSRRTNRSLENLHRIQECSLCRTPGCQNSLLLLHCVRDV